MLTMLPAMCGIVATWAMLGATCIGLGYIVFRATGARIRVADDVFSVGWVGWAVLLGFLQIWHLFLPVRAPALLAILGVGVAGLMWWGGRREGLIERAPEGTVTARCGETRTAAGALSGYIVVMLGFALWLANRGMGPLEPPYDAGLYHLNGIRWMREYAAVPGLGDLHIRFATMPSYFLYLALLDTVPWIRHPWSAAHGLLLWAAVAQIVWSGMNGLRCRRLRPHDLVAVLFLPVILKFCFLETSSTAYDLPVFLLGFAMCVQMVRCWDWGCEQAVTVSASPCGMGGHDTRWLGAGVTILSLGAVAVTIKLSAVFLVACTAVALAWSFAQAAPTIKAFLSTAMRWVLLPAILGVGWMVRNIVFSGYPFVPSTLFGLPVEWRVDAHALQVQAMVIMAWARDSRRPVEEVLANWNWFSPWLKGVIGYYRIEVTIPLVLALAAILLSWGGQRRRKLPFGWAKMVLLLPAVVALVCWVATAPDPRFAGAAFWWLASISTVLACESWGGTSRVRCWLPVVLLALALTAWFDLRLTKYTRPGPLAGGYYPVPESRVKTFVTESGLTVYVPEVGDQVWDSPLPATPYPDPKLELRRHGLIQSGFKR